MMLNQLIGGIKAKVAKMANVFDPAADCDDCLAFVIEENVKPRDTETSSLWIAEG